MKAESWQEQSVSSTQPITAPSVTAPLPATRSSAVSRRRFSSAVGVLASLGGPLAFAACGEQRAGTSSGTPVAAAGRGSRAITPEAGTLTWFLWGASPERLELYQQIAQNFHAEHNTVKVDPVVPAGEGSYFDKLKTQLAAGQQVDVIGASPVWVPDVAETSLGRELNGFLARDKQFKIGDYAKGVVDAGTWKGKLYMLTLFSNFNVLYYNKALFDKAGVKYPDESWTRDQVLDAAKRLTQSTGGPETSVYGFNFARDLNNVLPWIWQNGGDAFDRPEAPTKATMSSAATLDAFSWLVDAINKQRVAPGAGGESVPNFNTGRIAMMTQGVNQIGGIAAKAQFPWDIAIHPKGKAGRPNYAGTLFYGLSQTTKLPDAAWTFLKYLCGPPGQRLFVNGQVGAPVHKDLTKEYEKLPPPPENRKAVIDTLPHLRALPKTPKMMEIYSPVFTKHMAEAFAGKTSATEAARQIDDQVAAVLSG